MFRYRLVHSYTLEDDSEVVEVIARAVDVDWFFSDPVPVGRERVVLRGCPLSFACLAGDFVLEAGVGDELQWWRLTDLVVHGTVPNGSLVDVVATAAARLVDEGPAFGSVPRHVLTQEGLRVGSFVAADGFPRPWQGHEWPPVTLVGVDRADLNGLQRRAHMIAGGERLQALDRYGRIMTDLPIEIEVSSVSPSALGDGLFDVVLDQSSCDSPPQWRDRPAPSARAVWDLWREGVPAERNLWSRFDTGGRTAWADLTFPARETFGTDAVGGTYHLDGRHTTDVPGLHLALSEALVGPGGYFGREFNGFKDCLCGGWGVKPGFTLIWNDAQVAHDAIRVYFQDILKLLRRFGVTVELKSSSFLDGVRELDRRMELGALTERWVAGWVKGAGLPAEPYPDSWNVRVDQPGMRIERVLTDEGATDWHSTLIYENDWITVPTTAPEKVTEILAGVNLEIRPRETFMRRALADHPAPPAPEGYELRVARGDVIEVALTADGEEAASGLIAVIGDDAVPHRIRTSPEHRRRGLGSVVMGVLAREAVDAGAVDGLLFASEDGLHLYRKLGWTTISDVVIASNTKGEA
ncbi:GNAT family N-acetyltransferase [Lentzea nigeriaca]|uniref:GNAT family N-acetyltransferase n=1 Tax=Lentzea nigeriaca TaxID=1128665 RepID=UPI00195C0F50|nr:GNAT family N-acetyltransferase [Lentzea nigeriaca]MBM7860537.1 GNAT superfamily N-acetyltransferase/RNAse (barnase) inhibitor barstar [Lentzea nigeriaca]